MIYRATELKIEKTRIEIGVKEPFRLLHVTDTHLIYADDTDSEQHRTLMKLRREAYDSKHGDNCCRRWGDAVFDYAKKRGDLLVHTGDLIDFVSHGNLVEAKNMLATLPDYFFIAGNHEYSQYVGTWPDEPGFAQKNEARVQAAFKDNVTCFSRLYKGVILFGADTRNYQFSQAQLDAFRAQLSRGLPVLVFYHEPVYTPELRDYIVNVVRESDHLTIGEPEELREINSSYQPTESTQAFMDELLHNPLVKGAFTGHFHFSYDCKMPSGAFQYLTAGSFLGMAREVEIV